MDRTKLEVADIFRRYGEAYRQQHDGSLSTAQRRVMTAIEVCRNAATAVITSGLATTAAGTGIAQSASHSREPSG